MAERQKRRGRLFVISGPSGTGKGTICKQLCEVPHVSLSVSMTTRKPRGGETEGKSYYFVSEETFKETIAAGLFLEYAQVFGCYYGTPKQKVFDRLEAGEDVILEIDTQGAAQVKERHPEGVFIFILPPSMRELRKRITERGTETAEMIDARLGEAMGEIARIGLYDYCVVNSALSEALAKVKAIIAAERARVPEDTCALIKKYKEEL